MIKDAYMVISIYMQHRKYLRFSCQGIAYQFHSLPLGQQQPHESVEMSHIALRVEGIWLLIYLEDTPVMSTTHAETKSQLQRAIDLLENVGLS